MNNLRYISLKLSHYSAWIYPPSSEISGQGQASLLPTGFIKFLKIKTWFWQKSYHYIMADYMTNNLRHNLCKLSKFWSRNSSRKLVTFRIPSRVTFAISLALIGSYGRFTRGRLSALFLSFRSQFFYTLFLSYASVM